MRTILLVLSLVVAVPSCASSKCADPAHRNDTLCAVKDAVVDCTTAEAKTLISEFAPIVEALILKATGADGTIDWSSLEGAFEKAGVADGACVLASVSAKLAGTPKAEAKAGIPAHESVVRGFDSWRAAHAGGVKFKLEDGSLR